MKGVESLCSRRPPPSDSSVQFEDVFCSAKLDCAYDGLGVEPINLLFDPLTGERAQTAVLAFACSGGAGASDNTTLHFTQARFQCADGGQFMAQPATCTGADGGTTVYGIFAAMTGAGNVELSGKVWQKTAGVFALHTFRDIVQNLTFDGTTWTEASVSMPMPTNTDDNPDTLHMLGGAFGANATSVFDSMGTALFWQETGNGTWHMEVLPNPIDNNTGNPYPAVTPKIPDPTTYDIWAVAAGMASGPNNPRAILFPYEGDANPGFYSGVAANYALGMPIPEPANVTSAGCLLALPTGGVRPGFCFEQDGAGPVQMRYHIWRHYEDGGGHHLRLDNGDGAGLPVASAQGGPITDFGSYRTAMSEYDGLGDVFGVVTLGSTLTVVANVLYLDGGNADVSRIVVLTLDGGGNWVAAFPTITGSGSAGSSFFHVIATTNAQTGAARVVASGWFDPGGGPSMPSAVFAYNATTSAWDHWDEVHVPGDPNHGFDAWALGPKSLLTGMYRDSGNAERIFVARIPTSNGTTWFDGVNLPMPPGVSVSQITRGGVFHYRPDGKVLLAMNATLHGAVPEKGAGAGDSIITWTLDPTQPLATMVTDYAKIDGPTYLATPPVANLQPLEVFNGLEVYASTEFVGARDQYVDSRWDFSVPNCTDVLSSMRTSSLTRQLERGFAFDVTGSDTGQIPSDEDELAMSTTAQGFLDANLTNQVLDLNKPKGNVWGAGNPDTNASDALWQYAVTYGDEYLMCGGVSCNKRYFTAAFGFDPAVPGCWLHFDATASGNETAFVNSATPAGTMYPVIRMSVPLTAETGGGLTCTQNPLGGASSGVYAQYTSFGQVQHFCHAYAGGPTISDVCGGVPDDYSYDTFGGGGASGGGGGGGGGGPGP